MITVSMPARRRDDQGAPPAEKLNWPDAESHAEKVAAAIGMVRDELHLLRAENAAMRAAGGRLANAAHNLAAMQPNAPWQTDVGTRLNEMFFDWQEAWRTAGQPCAAHPVRG